jgi:two-component system, cell cycle sensor histidine kinase and response regulator CckA
MIGTLPKLALISHSEAIDRAFSNLFREHFKDCRLSKFKNAEALIETLLDKPIQGIIVELGSQEGEAIEILRLIKSSPLAKEIPVMLISKNGDLPSKFTEAALMAGADDVLRRPLDDRELSIRIRLLLRLKKAEDEKRAAGAMLKVMTAKHREALISSERRYRRLVEISPDTIAVCTNGSITFINDAGKRIFRAEHLDDLLEKQIISLVHPDSREVMNRIMTECVVGDEHVPFVLAKMKALDETLIRVEAAAVRFDDQDHRHVLLVIRDIGDRTELSEKFRQAQRMEAVGQLAGGVAHDFNNILTTIRGYCDLILDSLKKEDPLIEDVREIKNATGRAGALTRQLLAFSRRQVLDPAPLDLNRVIVNLRRMLQRMIGDHIALTTDLEPDLGIIKADRSQIEQVIMNLAVNARDAMPEGGEATIRTYNIEIDSASDSLKKMDLAPGPHVVIEVRDTGMGMNQETIFHIFEPFFTTKAKDKGTGLGLSTVYGIVKQSGGDIDVESEVGNGTLFRVFLPVESDLVAAMAPVKTENGPARGNETILLVEDDKTVRYLTKRLLERAGYTVLTAGHGTEALYIADQYEGAIHVILTDVVMPEMGGLKLVEKLMEKHPYVKAVMMSGYTDKKVVSYAAKLPGAAFLQKPFSYEELTNRVRRLLDAKGEPPKKPQKK